MNLPSSFYGSHLHGPSNVISKSMMNTGFAFDPIIKELKKAQLKAKYDTDDPFTEINAFKRDYNQKYIEQLQDLSSWKYPGFAQAIRQTTMEALSQRKSETCLPPEVLDPLINAYHQKTVILEKEYDSLQRDHQKMAGLIEILIEDNKQLRDHIAAKTTEMAKLVQTIGANDGELVMNLKKQNKILNDEINSLLLHFEEARGYKEKYESVYDERTQDSERSRSLFEQLQFDLEEAKKREMELAEENENVMPQVKELQEENSRLTLENTRLREDLENLIRGSENMQKTTALDTKRNEANMRSINEELDRLTRENSNLTTSNIVNVWKSLGLRRAEGTLESIKAKKESDLFRSQYNDGSMKLSEAKSLLALEQAKLQDSVRREANLQEKIVRLSAEADSNLRKIKDFERRVAIDLEKEHGDNELVRGKLESRVAGLERALQSAGEANEKEKDGMLSELSDLRRQVDRKTRECERHLATNAELQRQLEDAEQLFKREKEAGHKNEEEFDRMIAEVTKARQEKVDQMEVISELHAKVRDLEHQILTQAREHRMESSREPINRSPQYRNRIFTDEPETHNEEIKKRESPEGEKKRSGSMTGQKANVHSSMIDEGLKARLEGSLALARERLMQLEKENVELQMELNVSKQECEQIRGLLRMQRQGSSPNNANLEKFIESSSQNFQTISNLGQEVRLAQRLLEQKNEEIRQLNARIEGLLKIISEIKNYPANSPDSQSKKFEDQVLLNFQLREEIESLRHALSQSTSSEIKSELKARLAKLEAEVLRLTRENAALRMQTGQSSSNLQSPHGRSAAGPGSSGIFPRGGLQSSPGFYHMDRFGASASGQMASGPDPSRSGGSEHFPQFRAPEPAQIAGLEQVNASREPEQYNRTGGADSNRFGASDQSNRSRGGDPLNQSRGATPNRTGGADQFNQSRGPDPGRTGGLDQFNQTRGSRASGDPRRSSGFRYSRTSNFDQPQGSRGEGFDGPSRESGLRFQGVIQEEELDHPEAGGYSPGYYEHFH